MMVTGKFKDGEKLKDGEKKKKKKVKKDKDVALKKKKRMDRLTHNLLVAEEEEDLCSAIKCLKPTGELLAQVAGCRSSRQQAADSKQQQRAAESSSSSCIPHYTGMFRLPACACAKLRKE